MLQRHKLLIQQLPQADEFVRFAKFLGLDDLVELLGVGRVVLVHPDAAQLVGTEVRRVFRFRLGAKLREVHVGVHLDHGRLALAVLVAQRVLVQRHVLRRVLGLGFGGVLHRFDVLVAVVVLRLIVEFGRESEILQNRTAATRKLLLIQHVVGQRLDVLPGAFLHEVAPEAHHVLRRRGQFATGQALPDDQAHRHRQRRLGLRGDGIECRLLADRFKRRLQVPGDTFHAHRADGGNPRVLHPLEHLLGRPRTRLAAPMHTLVVVAELQRELVANAAQGVQFLLAATQVRQRHVDVVAAHTRSALAEGDIEFVVLGKRAHRRAGGPLVNLKRFVRVVHRLPW